MRIAARHNQPVAVHAESEELTRASEGTGIDDYLRSRPILAELEAIQRAALLARESGARLYIVHVSSAQGVKHAALFRSMGIAITIETCPHYLALNEDDLRRMGAVAK